MNIGETIQKLREERQINLYSLAKQTGLGITQLRKIEEGKTNTSIEIAEKLLNALDHELQVVKKEKEG